MSAAKANEEIIQAKRETRNYAVRENELKREYSRKIEEIRKLNAELQDKANELEVKYKVILAKTQEVENDK